MVKSQQEADFSLLVLLPVRLLDVQVNTSRGEKSTRVVVHSDHAEGEITVLQIELIFKFYLLECFY